MKRSVRYIPYLLAIVALHGELLMAQSLDEAARSKALENRIEALERELGLVEPELPATCAGVRQSASGDIFEISSEVISRNRSDKVKLINSFRVVINPESKNRGARFLAIQPESFLICLGIRNHDLIQSVDGKSFQNAAEFVDIILGSEAEPGKVFKISVIRFGAQMELKFLVLK